MYIIPQNMIVINVINYTFTEVAGMNWITERSEVV